MGSLLISASLREFGSFSPFLYGISFAILAGSFMFLAMPRGDTRKVGEHVDEAEPLPQAAS
jgi:hypothetical protein